ncbi:MAG: 16S rRNA (cytosine(967)-C(5))-methyltransferase RsmB [Clostridia bacterium]|nr:16S rRNA (cytosine(967)-C(5))-methyltransferase RsmB [Clostridia bacterium]
MDKDRRLAFLILKDMEQKDSYSNLVINAYLKDGAGNPAFIRELVYGVLRNQLLLDWNIRQYQTKAGRLKPAERVLLRMGFYQLAFMNSVPSYAAVGETVKLAAAFMKGRQGFINALLRSFERDGSVLKVPDEKKDGELTFLSVKYSCNEEIVRLWLDAYGRDKTEEMLAASNRTAPLTIRVNTLKIRPFELKDKLISKGFSVTEGSLSRSFTVEGSGLIDTEEFKNGFFQVQDEASQLAVETLDPKPGDELIDLCAAPGGKCCAAAVLMENKGHISAFDYYEARAGLIEKLADRLGITIINASQADAAVLKEELIGKADCVICDVPCSGLGVLRRKPEIKLRPLDEDYVNLPEKQNRILHNASLYVNLKGGKVLYSTCTVNPAENRRVIDRFLKDNPDFAVETERQLFPGKSDGFYICLLRRQND